MATDAPLVAFTTAAMVPCPGWLSAMTGRLLATGASGVGGPIEPGNHLSPTDRAVALLRYAGYFPTRPDAGSVEPPGDNALYRRDRLIDVAESWADGFWENDVHRALRAQGEILAMAGSAVVSFQGGIGLGAMVLQRFAHARCYGKGRSKRMSLVSRLARAACWPLVPPLLAGRIVGSLRTRRMSLRPWLPALPGLVLLASAWAIGEAVGMVGGTDRSPQPLFPDPMMAHLKRKVRS